MSIDKSSDRLLNVKDVRSRERPFVQNRKFNIYRFAMTMPFRRVYNWASAGLQLDMLQQEWYVRLWGNLGRSWS
jgi:hypothetical protein